MGLARATQVTGDATYAEHSWQYLDWYASVEQPGTGYVTDYDIENGTTPVSDGNMDSTDAYAGTFLAAAWDTYYVTDDRQQLAALAPGIAGALHAIESTQQSDGLTWAKPSWQVAYLMDNAQAFGGLEGAAALETALGNSSLATEAANDASRMKSGIESLWDPGTGAYDWAKQANGWQHPTDWGNFYPDAMEQMSAVLWGAVSGSRASKVMGEVQSHHPDWDEPTALDNYLNGATVEKQAVSYWPSVGEAMALGGENSTGLAGVENILSAASQVGWGWPYTTGDAGDAIVALSGMAPLDPTTGSIVTLGGGGGSTKGGHGHKLPLPSGFPSPVRLRVSHSGSGTTTTTHRVRSPAKRSVRARSRMRYRIVESSLRTGRPETPSTVLTAAPNRLPARPGSGLSDLWLAGIAVAAAAAGLSSLAWYRRLRPRRVVS